MHRSAKCIGVLLLGGLWLALPGSAVADFIVNGGFETGDFTGWTLGGDTTDPTTFGVDTSFPLPPSKFAAYFGAFGDQVSIMQTITTIPGETYVLDFYLMNESGGSPNQFTVSFGSQVLDDESNMPTFAYKEFNYVIQATAASTNVTFAFRNDFAFFDLDNVSLVARSVPEPTSLYCFGVGAILVFARAVWCRWAPRRVLIPVYLRVD